MDYQNRPKGSLVCLDTRTHPVSSDELESTIELGPRGTASSGSVPFVSTAEKRKILIRAWARP